MLHLLDHSLESFLRAAVPLDDDVEVAFDTPDREWVAKLAQPTVDLFLYDVRPDRDSRQAGWEIDRRPEGAWRRRSTPRATCRYLITAWANDPDDEHQLLGAVLALLLQPRRLPPEHLPDGLARADGLPVLTVGFDDPSVNIADMWSALGGQLRPGVDLKVDLAIEALPLEVGPLGAPVVRAEGAVHRRDDGEDEDWQTRVGGRTGATPAGARVRSPRGSAPIQRGRRDDDARRPGGRFLVRAESGDRLFLDPDDRTAVVPDEGPADFPGAGNGEGGDHGDTAADQDGSVGDEDGGKP
jgi:hypothetical protein